MPLREDAVVNAIDNLEFRINCMEQWSKKHEAEGIEYGNEFEDRDNQLYDKVEALTERINILWEAIIAINEKISGWIE